MEVMDQAGILEFVYVSGDDENGTNGGDDGTVNDESTGSDYDSTGSNKGS